MFEKIAVKGSNQHPLYHWLQVHSKHRVTWNFCKYLIDKTGNVVAFYPSKVDPLDPAIVSKIQSLL
jgi:glutathione peroxidase